MQFMECRLVQLPWKSPLSVLGEQQKVLPWIPRVRERKRDVGKSDSVSNTCSHERKSCWLPKNSETLIWLCFHSQALNSLELSLGLTFRI